MRALILLAAFGLVAYVVYRERQQRIRDTPRAELLRASKEMTHLQPAYRQRFAGDPERHKLRPAVSTQRPRWAVEKIAEWRRRHSA